MTVLEQMRQRVDATVDRLAATEFRIDPIAGRKFSRVPALIGSVQKRHGLLLEAAIRTAVDNLPQYSAWRVDAFRISPDAVGIVAGINNVKKNPDWLHILEQRLAYGNMEKEVQIDLVAYNGDTEKIFAIEVKRGYSSHDSGKKKSILKDTLCVQMLLRSYGESEGLRIAESKSLICNFYKSREFDGRISIDKDGLDELFGGPVLGPVEEVNHHFRQRVQDLLNVDVE